MTVIYPDQPELADAIRYVEGGYKPMKTEGDRYDALSRNTFLLFVLLPFVHESTLMPKINKQHAG